MKNGSKVLCFLVFLLLCLTKVQASNLSLILGYDLIIDGKTEIEISQVENLEVQPLTEKVSIKLSNNYIVIQDTTDKALVLSAKSSDSYQMLKLFKEKCLDKLGNANCLNEFVEEFYTLFDPFGLEYQFLGNNGQIIAKLVKKDQSKGLKIATQVNDILYLQSPEMLGSVKIYDISSGREIFSEKLDYGQNSLDISCLRKGAYIMVCNKKSLKFIKL